MCYVTLRGLVYFGASIHVYHGIQLMLNMCYNLFSDGRDYYVSKVDIIFNWCFLVLGIFIFRGVEQQSKTFIRWPTVGFTLLLALRFIVELLKQYQYEREAIYQTLKTLGPFTYTNMSIDVDPLISAAVGIYIFILFVYNHSLEYSPDSHINSRGGGGSQQNCNGGGSGRNGEGGSDTLPFHHRSSNNNTNNGRQRQGCGGYLRRNDSSNDSSDTAHLIPRTGSNLGGPGDSNNNMNDAEALLNNNNNESIIPPMSTHPNPLYEYDQAIRMMDARRPHSNHLNHPPSVPRSQQLFENQHQHALGTMQYKVESV